MGDYKDNLIIEQLYIADKIEKLNKFINSSKFNELDHADIQLLYAQYNYMSRYNHILMKRLKRIDAKKEK